MSHEEVSRLSKPRGRMVRIFDVLAERHGWPNEPGQLQRPPGHRVKALHWQLNRFAEMVADDSTLAHAVIDGHMRFSFRHDVLAS